LKIKHGGTSMNKILAAVVIVVFAASTAHAQQLYRYGEPMDESKQLHEPPPFEGCECVRGACNKACTATATPDVIDAIRKRFRRTEITDAGMNSDGIGNYETTFYTTKAHMACRLFFKPKVRLGSCRIIHG
jgi:hypothetical protein